MSVTLHDLGKSACTGKHRENPDRNAQKARLKELRLGEDTKTGDKDKKATDPLQCRPGVQGKVPARSCPSSSSS
jgi:hypothetical protein